MSESARLEKFPAHTLYGENAHWTLIAALMELGMMLAAAAMWLAPMDFAAPANAAIAAKTQIKDAQVLSTSSVSPVTVAAPESIKPLCPDNISFLFASGSAVPLALSVPAKLDSIVDWTTRHPSTKVSVEGFADAVGQEESNLLLSYQRAKAVATILAKAGITKDQVQVVAAGSHSAVVGGTTDASIYRKVTLQVLDHENCQSVASK